MKWLEIVKNLLFPEVRCISCEEPRKLDPGSALCDDCAASLQSLLVSKNTCERCLSPQKAGEQCAYCAQGGMRDLERAYAPYVYKGAVQKLIVRLKFGPCDLAAQPLANAMAETISGVRADAMVPVPLHRSGLRERGINQSLLLCQLIAPKVNAPILEALRKDRRTKRQSSLHHKDREANVKDAYTSSV